MYNQHIDRQQQAYIAHSHHTGVNIVSNLNINNTLQDIDNMIDMKRQHIAKLQYNLYMTITIWIAIAYLIRITGCHIRLSQYPMDTLANCWWNTTDLICKLFNDLNTVNGIPETITGSAVFGDIFTTQSSTPHSISDIVDSIISMNNLMASLSIGTTEDFIYALMEALKGMFPSLTNPISMLRYRCLFSIIGRCIIALVPSLILNLLGLSFISSYISPMILLYVFLDIVVLLWRDIMKPMIVLQAFHWGCYFVMCLVDKVSWSAMKLFSVAIVYICFVTIACFI